MAQNLIYRFIESLGKNLLMGYVPEVHSNSPAFRLEETIW